MFYDFRGCACLCECVFARGFPPQLISRGIPFPIFSFVFMPFCILYIFVQNLCALLFLWHAPISPPCAIYPSSWKKAKMLSLFERHFNASPGWVEMAMGMGSELDWGCVVGWLSWHFSANYGTCGDVGIMPDPSAFDMAYRVCISSHTRVCFYVNPYMPGALSIPLCCHLSCLCGKYIK